MSASDESCAVANTDPETWLEEHGDILYACAMGRVHDEHVAEELVQETLMTAIERRATFEGRSTVRTWLVGILRFKVLQYFQQSSRRRETITDVIGPELVESQFTKLGKWKTDPQNWGQDPSNPPEVEELRGVLEQCLLKLPNRVAEAFLLVEQGEMACEQLGELLKATASNVYVMLHRARAALRKCLERNWFGDDAGERD